MISLDEARALTGKTMKGAGGDKLGTIDTLYADRDNGEPTFATIHTGMFGSKTSFVPLSQATLSGEDLTVPYDKDLVGRAPSIDKDSDLSPEEEERLYAHYGIGASGTGTDMGTDIGAGTTDEARSAVGHDTSGPTTDEAMTRSEERLEVGTQRQEVGRARLRKFITTEQQTVDVPVSHEEVTVSREPITDGNVGQALDGPALSEEEHEIVLHEQVPQIAKETVPVERVRLGKETVTEQATVTEEVRKEQIETDGLYPEGSAGRTGADAPRTAGS